MKKIIVLIWFCLFSGVILIAKPTPDYSYLYKNLPFSMPKVQVPRFPKTTFSILDFGAIGDAVTLNTEAFEKAMLALNAKGGGTLQVPSGVYYTGPITFYSNINLHLQDGAVIIFSDNFSDYKLIKTSFEGLETRRCISPLNAIGATNVAITGNGVIDGNGDAWRFVKKNKMTASQWKKLTQKGVLSADKQLWFPTENSRKGYELSAGNFNVPQVESEEQWEEIHEWLRPVLLSFVRCKNVYLQGVTFQNSPSWNLHPNMCEHVIIDGITVRNPWYSQNGDGLDLESCTNALVVNSKFDVGDDAICIKSGKDADGRKRAMPCQNVIIDNCMVFHGHGGFVVGSEMSGGVKNVLVSNCQFLGTDVGLRFKSVRGRGGVVEHIYMNNINMMNIATDALLFDLYYSGKSATETLEDGDILATEESIPLVTEETPIFRHISIKNITCRGALRAMFFNGLPEMNISDVVVENVSIYATQGAELSEVDGILLKHVQVVANNEPALMLNNVSNAHIDDFTCPEAEIKVLVKGVRTKRVTIHSKQILKNQVKQTKMVLTDAVDIN